MPRTGWWILAVSSLSLAARDAGAICREVTEKGSSPPAVEADQEVLIIKRTAVPVGCEQPAPDRDGGAHGGDGGPASDGGAPGDAAPRDAAPADAAPGDAAPADAAPADAAPADAGPCQPHIADTVTWIVQPRFSTGPDGSRFALLMVTPHVPVIETAPDSTFEDLARATAPISIVEERTIEDESLGYQCQDPKFSGAGAGCGGSVSHSGGNGDWTPPDPSGDRAADAGGLDGYIPVRAVGSYQVVVLAATDADELAVWLDGAGYAHEPADIDAIRPYLELGWTITAVRVASEEAIDVGGLEPLSFTFEGSELRLPLGIARGPVGSRALIKVYVAAEGRYDLPDASLAYAGLTPDLTFLTASYIDADLSRPADDDPVLVRAPDDEPFQRSYTKVVETRIPSSYCPDQDGFCDCRAGGSPSSQAGTLLLAAGCAALVLRRRRRPRQ